MHIVETVTTVLAAATLMLVAACGGGAGAEPAAGGDRELVITAIPDQDPDKLQRLYGQVSDYLGEQLGVTVTHQPVTDCTASVTAFRRGDVDAAFFGGLSGSAASCLAITVSLRASRILSRTTPPRLVPDGRVQSGASDGDPI